MPWDRDPLNWTGDLDFTDSIALLEEDELKLQHAMTVLDEEANHVGLRISSEKSKIMYVSSTTPVLGIVLEQQQLEEVERFTYLNSVITRNGDAEVDIKCHIGKAIAVFWKKNKFWSLLSISLKIKFCLLASVMILTATVFMPVWLGKRQEVSTRVYFYHITNEEVLWRSGSWKLQNIVARRKLQVAGYIFHMRTIGSQRWQWLGTTRTLK